MDTTVQTPLEKDEEFLVDDPVYTPAMLDRHRKDRRDRLQGFRADDYYVNALEEASYDVGA